MHTYHLSIERHWCQGMDFDGFDLMRKPGLRDKHRELIASCLGTPGCHAVNTNGWLKSGVAVSVVYVKLKH